MPAEKPHPATWVYSSNTVLLNGHQMGQGKITVRRTGPTRQPLGLTHILNLEINRENITRNSYLGHKFIVLVLGRVLQTTVQQSVF